MLAAYTTASDKVLSKLPNAVFFSLSLVLVFPSRDTQGCAYLLLYNSIVSEERFRDSENFITDPIYKSKIAFLTLHRCGENRSLSLYIVYTDRYSKRNAHPDIEFEYT